MLCTVVDAKLVRRQLESLRILKEIYDTYRYCFNNAQIHRPDILNLNCPLNRTELSIVTSGRNMHVIIMTYTNGAWFEILLSWACYLHKLELKMVVLAMNPTLCDDLQRANITGILCKHIQPEMTLGNTDRGKDVKEYPWGSKGYQTLIKYKTPALYSFLLCGHPVLLLDTDVLMLRNPISLLLDITLGKHHQESGSSIEHGNHLNSEVNKTDPDMGSVLYDVVFAKDSTGWVVVDLLFLTNWVSKGYVCAGRFSMSTGCRGDVGWAECRF